MPKLKKGNLNQKSRCNQQNKGLQKVIIRPASFNIYIYNILSMHVEMDDDMIMIIISKALELLKRIISK